MANPFQPDDKVVFFQDKKTGHLIGTNSIKESHLRNGTVLTVIESYLYSNEPIVECKDTSGLSWSYHQDDLRLADDGKTEDERYLDNLLKGAN